MSTIQDIMAELQAGEHAKQQIPELSRRIALLEGELNRAQQHNQELELRAKTRDDTISMLTQKTAKLTEERDDASFRVLEAEDKLSTFAKAVGNAWGGIGNALNAVNPPKVEPQPAVAEVKAEQVPLAGQTTTSGAAHSVQSDTASSQGQSERPPQLASTTATDASGQSSASTQGNAGGSSISGEGQSVGSPIASAEPAAGPVPATDSGGASHNTGVGGPDPWKPTVEMPEVKAEEPKVYSYDYDPKPL